MSLDLIDKPASATDVVPTALSPLEIEVVDLFVQVSRLLALPRSTAEIYGLLFISTRPLSMDDLMLRLNLSKGSASQGLKFLRQVGAIKSVYVAGNRRDHYSAEMELRKLILGFLREKVTPHLDSGQQRLDRMDGLLRGVGRDQKTHYTSRVDALKRWEKSGRKLLPMVVRLLGEE
jgi:DNA-binding transcriptional regulator GbsR (MarR family)